MLKPRKKALGTPWTPHKYQKKGVKFLLENQNAGLLFDPGLGKTSVTYAAICLLLKAQTARGALIIAPINPMYLVWPAERDKWADFAHMRTSIIHGDGDAKKERALDAEADIYLINHEGLDWLFGSPAPAPPNTKGMSPADKEKSQAAFKKIKAEWGVEEAKCKVRRKKIMDKCDILVFDELSKFKHADTLRFKVVKPHLKRFTRRWGLTGSPAPNGLLDLFGQCYVLDEGHALGPFISHYRANYFDSVGYGGYTYVPKHGADKAIQKQLKPLMLRMDADDHLELPEKIDHIIKIDLPEKARKVYDQMEQECVAELDLSTVTAASTGVASGKCRQIASGAIYLDPVDPLTGIPRTGKRQFEVIHDAKIKALLDLLEELQGQPALIAYEFQHDIERIKKAMRKKELPQIGSGATRAHIKAMEAKWNNNELPYLFGQTQSIALGLNLQDGDACHVIWFVTTWDYEMYDQLIRRLRRQGNKSKKIFVHHLVIKDSVDEDVMNAIRTKKRTQDNLLDALNTYRARKPVAAKAKMSRK